MGIPLQETVDEILAVAEVCLAGKSGEGRLQIQEIAIGCRVQNAKNTPGGKAEGFGGLICISLVNQNIGLQLQSQGYRVNLAFVQPSIPTQSGVDMCWAADLRPPGKTFGPPPNGRWRAMVLEFGDYLVGNVDLTVKLR